MAGYEHLDDLASELRTAFDEGASGAGSGAGSKRSAAAVVDQDSAEAPWRTAPDMQPGPVPLGLVGSDDPLRVGTTSTFRHTLALVLCIVSGLLSRVQRSMRGST